MKTAVLATPFVLAIALIVYTEDSFSGFTVWNALPVAMGLGAVLATRRSRPAVLVGCTAFAATATLLVVLFHLAWFFDWDGTATGSSTSALAFVFVPPWACLFAGIAGVLAWGIVRATRKHRAAR